MPQSTEHARGTDRALARVEAFFDGVFAPLEEWLPRLRQQLSAALAVGPVTGHQLAGLVEADAHAILDAADRPLYGAGYCASDRVVSEGNPLAWWQGDDRTLLASSTFGPGQAAIDLVRLEWYRIPQATAERHIAGPFVDYLCSNEITVTSSLPVTVHDEFVGVVCADVLVASLETALLPGLGPGVALVNASGRVVISNDPDYETGDRYGGADTFEGVAGLLESGRALRSERYPFALVTTAAAA